MIHGTVRTLATGYAVALACLLAAGCTCLQRATPAEPAVASAPATALPADTPAVQQGTEASLPTAPIPNTPAQPVAPVAVQPVRPAPPVPEPRGAVAKAPPAAATRPAEPPPIVAAAPARPAPAVPTPAAVPAKPGPSPAPLDFKGLEARLRQTRAIGVFTKLALKNQVDDLLARFREYHQRRGAATLAELRRNYDMLLLKVLSLLQDTDPPLARDIVKSRAAMWSILEDPRKFSEFTRMAGPTS